MRRLIVGLDDDVDLITTDEERTNENKISLSECVGSMGWISN